MNKRNIIIISLLILVILGAAGYFFFFKKTATRLKPETIPDTTTPTDTPLVTETPSTTVPLVTSVCPVSFTGQLDTDQDNLPDSVETIYKTDLNSPDTDSDGYKDGEEVRNGYDPLVSGSARLDSDQDGLTDDQECKWNTDPFNADTDGDSYKDGEEITNGYDPLISGSARLATTSPTPSIGTTPTPSGLTFGTPTPTPTAIPTATPKATVSTPTTSPVSFTKVTRTELNISKNNSAAAIKDYLAIIDQSSPSALIGGTPFSDALIAAFNGDASKLQPILTQLNQYEKGLLKISTPESAVNHQIIFVSLTRSVNQQLTIIAAAAGKDPEKQYTAGTNLQKILSDNLSSLKIERQKLDTLAAQ